MGQILSIHSYRGGTGKSNLSANLAYQAVRRGRRVAVLDTDLQSPGVHMVLGLPAERMAYTLSDYLFGRCELEEAAYDLSNDVDVGDAGGALYLLPSSMKVDKILRIVSDGYDVGKLNDHFGKLMRDLDLDLLVLDTHPGLNRETMMSTAVSQGLLLVMRPDAQDFHGTAVLMEVASRLGVPHIYMMANKVPKSLDRADVRQKMEKAFGVEVLGLLPLAEELAVLGSRGLFTVEFPEHEASLELNRILDRLLAGLGADVSR
ncbi:MAG: MinD/ParA family ATP-binding protein [Planctomycetota bacterium]|jgi:MinD-like ATPase involved in chromosome partitioning or flagellar assembly